MTAYTETVVKYFAEKADEYDRTDEQHYWRLSDELLWTLLLTKVIPNLPPDAKILDAGGGTGRWTKRLLEHLPQAKSMIFDLSEEMTHEARVKLDSLGLGDRTQIVIGNLDNVQDEIGNCKFDLIISFHNVLGFVKDPEAVVSGLTSLLTPRGMVALFVPNESHAAYFNIAIGNLVEADEILSTHKGRFTSTMPEMHMFTAAGIRQTLSRHGLTENFVVGTPVLIYPGYAESQIEGNTEGLKDLLSSDDNFARVFEMEKALLCNESLADRGNNLFALGSMPH